MIEFLKLFTEEPQKLSKLTYAILKVLLSLALMFISYDWILGRKIANDLTNINQILLLFRQGLLLTMVFLYYVSYLFLFEIIPFFWYWVTILMQNLLTYFGILRREVPFSSITFALERLHIIQEKDDDNNKWYRGRNFDVFYELYYNLIDADENEKLPKTNQLLHVLIAFAFVYFIDWETKYHHIIGTVLIISIGLVIIVDVYIKWLVKAIRQNQSQIEVIINWLAVVKIVLELTKRMGFEEVKLVRTEETETPTEVLYSIFRYLEKDYIIYGYYSEASIKKTQINKAIELSKKIPECHLIFVVSNELSVKGRETWESYTMSNKTLIIFKNEDELIEKFMAEFE